MGRTFKDLSHVEKMAYMKIMGYEELGDVPGPHVQVDDAAIADTLAEIMHRGAEFAGEYLDKNKPVEGDEGNLIGADWAGSAGVKVDAELFNRGADQMVRDYYRARADKIANGEL